MSDEKCTNLDTSEARARARVSDDVEGVGRERVQGTTGVVQQLEGLITRVDEGGGDLQVVDAIDGLGSGDLEGEAALCGHSDSGGSESHEGGAKGRGEHGDERTRCSMKDRRLERHAVAA